MYRFLFFLLFLNTLATSQSIQNKALPKITHYDTKNMGFASKSWDIKQDEDGLIYVANDDHILIYDGVTWKSVIPLPGISNRSLLVKSKDSIYFGADGHNGLLIKQGFSDYNIISKQNTSKDVVSDTEEYWRTYLINDEVVFQTFKNLYINQNNIITKIQAPYRFKWSYKVSGELYVNDLKEGIFKLVNTDLIPIASDPELNEHIVGVTDINKNLIVITDTKGLFSIKNKKLIPLNFPKSEALKKAQIFSFLKLKDGRIALGTVSNGLYLLDITENTIKNINKEKGLQNNTILSLYQDDQHNLWLALDYGIDHIKLNSELKYFYDSYGKLGTTYAVIQDGNFSFLGTNQGLYVSENTDDDSSFDLLLNGQVWNIDKIDTHIFIGHDKGAFTTNGKELLQIGDDLGAWNFRKYTVTPDKNVIISGNYNGISLYENQDGVWSGYKLTGFEKSSRFLEIDKENNIWVSLGSEGIFKFELHYDTKTLKNLAFYPPEDFEGDPVSLSKVNEAIIITSNNHSYTYNHKQNNFKKVALGKNKGYAPRIHKFGSQHWYLDDANIALEFNGSLKTYPELNDQLIPGVKSIFSIDSKNKIIPIYNGFAMHTLNKKDTLIVPREEVLIRNFASVDSENIYFDGDEIPYIDNDLKIEYSLPLYGQEILYRTRINEANWSAWSPATSRNLYNLKEGTYNFEVEAKHGNAYTKNASYTFVINPPLYRTIWAYLFYLLLFIIILLSAVSFNKYKMRKQEKILLQQKAEKLRKQEELHKAQKLEQERKIIELNNAKLQDEVKSKNRELTQIAYVNLNKNKILKKIKEKIIKVQENSETKLPTNGYNELVRLVEYYITDKESKLFEINFDKSHQDFYEKLSKRYPSLTSKDLRLCAYLKMNLSSKEIAPLLGISSQSVDVSRHRLRKKLNLEASDNLINALINLK